MIAAAGATACAATDALCCLCSTACCLSRCCPKCCGGGTGEGKEAPYPHGAGSKGSTWLMIIALSLALFGQFYAYKKLNSDGEGHVYAEDGKGAYFEAWDCGENRYPTCAQYSATERVSMAASSFFLLMALLGRCAPRSHDFAWDLKYLLFFGLLVCYIFLPTEVFDNHGYVWPARVGAFLFLLLQQIILVDFAYQLNETLLEWDNAESGSSSDEMCTRWKGLLLTLSIGTYLASITGIILMFVYFTGCTDNNTFISIALVAIVCFTILQLADADGNSGNNLLTSAVVAGYVTYLTYVAVSSNPHDSCNPVYNESNKPGPIIIGLILVLISTSATIYFSSRSITDLATGGHNSGGAIVNEALAAQLTGGTVESQPKKEFSDFGSLTAGEHSSQAPISRQGSWMDSDANGSGNRVATFNIAMMLIAMYWCMVLTDWGNVVKESASDSSPTAGKVVMWMNIVASWMCSLLYIWTIVAPKVFPDRDFSYKH